jgi:hypothetical protein
MRIIWSFRASLRFFRVTSSTCSDIGEVVLSVQLLESAVQLVVQVGELPVEVVTRQQVFLHL